MASGARIILTSPDPSSNNAHPDIEHESTIFSETDTDTVTFNAHATNDDDDDDASDVNTIEMNESAETIASKLSQKVKISIDSVSPYDENQLTSNENDQNEIEANDKEIESNHVESERESIDKSNVDEKRVKNDEL